MNKEAARPRKRGGKSGRIRDVLLLSALALLLIFAVWKIFYTDGSRSTAAVSGGTESERRLSALLSEIDGVGDVNVMIYEGEDGAKSVVVVCKGANNLRVNMDIREAVAAALGTDEKSVKIYLMKE